MAEPLVFALNGTRMELPEVDPSLTLLTFLRTRTALRGTKRGCGEGGCGACVVMVSRYDLKAKKIEEITVNSCLTLLCSLDGCAVTTTEGLGTQQTGHHAIHKRMSGFHASQCGYCTPGMTMALYGTLRRVVAKSGRIKPGSANGASCNQLPLTAAEAERAIAGNICRCTGYRPLLDTCKSFCPDVDVEDLGLHEFPAQDSSPAPYDSSRDPAFPPFLIRAVHHHNNATEITSNGGGNGHKSELVQARFRFSDSGAEEREKVWVEPESVADVVTALRAYQGSTAEVKLVAGNTAAGYYKDIKPNVYIDISKVGELLVLRKKADGIEVGASVTITNLIDFLEGLHVQEGKNGSPVPGVLARHLRKVASNHVRNWGSVGGNLVMAKRYGFASDVATILLGVDAEVQVASAGPSGSGRVKTKRIKLEEFIIGDQRAQMELLQSIWIPLHRHGHGAQTVRFETFRAAPRPLGFALAYVNASCFARVSDHGGCPSLDDVRLAFGAFGTKHAIRARRVEKHLNGKSLTWDVILEAIRLLRTEVVPVKGTRKARYRVSVAVSFLFQFLAPLLGGTEHHVSTSRDGPLNSGKQTITMSDEYYPVGQPATKITSELQASGEAVYVDDIPAPANCLHAALVMSQKALAKIRNVDVHHALQTPGTVAYISAADVPPNGANVGVSMGAMSRQNLFATDLVECVGHLMGVMIADTYDHAKEAAGRVEVDYDTDSVGPPILSATEAVQRNSYFPVHFLVAGTVKPVGDISGGFAAGEIHLENCKVITESQKHFYMETQAALALPDEDNCMVVYSSTQTPDYVQRTVAEALGVPYHNVRVITRRVGGAFGGKVFRSTAVAVACAIAAHKLRRPVRTSLDRSTDMTFIGGRSPTTSTFSVAFTKEGRITALKAQVLIEAGYEEDFSSFLPGDFMHALKKYNYGALEVEFKICRTNLVPKTAMRGPGHTQGSHLADAVMEEVASHLGLDPEAVRERNFHDMGSLRTYFGEGAVGGPESYSLPSLWKRLKASSNWEERERGVAKFNAKSKWVKRGLAMVPLIYTNANMSKSAMVSVFADGSIVLETPGVEIGQGLHTKVRQAASFALSKLFPKGRGIDLSRFRIVQMDTISVANSGVTSASTTSEGCCAAVQAACEILVERLTPLYQQLQAAAPDGEVSWEALVAKSMYVVDLKVHHRYAPEQYVYLNYAAAASEVEVNLLTGETQVLATDLVFDCGKSLNPAVDIGQIEGAFVQGIGFFVTEGVETEDGRELADGTWDYKVPTVDTIPKRFHVELFNSPALQERVLSSKAAGEAPFLLAGSVHSAIRKAILSARKERAKWAFDSDPTRINGFTFDPPASMDRVKTLCGFDNVEMYLASVASKSQMQC